MTIRYTCGWTIADNEKLHEFMKDRAMWFHSHRSVLELMSVTTDASPNGHYRMHVKCYVRDDTKCPPGREGKVA